MKPPLTVAIVTPSYNQGEYIEATVRSVLDQDWPNIDYLVRDAVSTDQTSAVLKRLQTEYGDRLRVITEKDGGQSDAINKGFSETHGDILAWMNSDDTFEPGAVRFAAEFFEANPDVALLYGDAQFITSDGRFIARCAHVEPYNWHRLVHYSDFIVQPAAFFRRSAFEAVGGIDKSLHYAMDYDLWLKIAAKYKVAYVPKMLANFRWFGQNKSGIGGTSRLDEIVRITKPFGARGLPAYYRIEESFLGLREAWAKLKEGHVRAAISRISRGFWATASSPRSIKSLLSPGCWKVMITGQVLRYKGRPQR